MVTFAMHNPDFAGTQDRTPGTMCILCPPFSSHFYFKTNLTLCSQLFETIGTFLKYQAALEKCQFVNSYLALSTCKNTDNKSRGSKRRGFCFSS
jgi:hypothetical protein